MNGKIKHTFTWSAIFLAFLVPLFSLVLLMAPMDHGSSGCPFMPGQLVVCPMSAFDHLDAWQAVFTNTLAKILTIAVALTGFVTYWTFVRKSDRPPPTRRRGYVLVPLLQSLFSDGILNPKAP